MTKFKSFGCGECGGRVVETKRAGRMHEYRRGVPLLVPASVAIPTCASCGEQYFSESTYEALEVALKPAYLLHLRAVVQAIRDAHGLSLAQVEQLCGVTKTYLNHVLGGTKDISQQLRYLLEAFSRAPAEVRRRLAGEPWTALSSSGSAATTRVHPAVPRVTTHWFSVSAPAFEAAPITTDEYRGVLNPTYAANDNEIAA